MPLVLKNQLDMLAVLAFSDDSHEEDREVWRTFLQLVLPILLEWEAKDIERAIEESVVRTTDELFEVANSVHATIRNISYNIAECVSLEPEWGLAAFLEGTRVHTKAHKSIMPSERLSPRDLLTNWIGKFSELQEDEDFAELVSQWKLKLDSCPEIESFKESA